MSLAIKLSENMTALGYQSTSETRELEGRLLHYLTLIEKWNRIHNLTAIRKSEDMLTHHIIDSLAVLPHINGPFIADIGSGAGLPGIPIALANPTWHVVLVESNQKKAAFLQQVRIELKLNNIEIISKRAEYFLPIYQINTIISRALSSLNDFIKWSGHLCVTNSCRLVAMKGIYIDSELKRLPIQYAIEKIIPITVPGLDAERHLVIIKKSCGN